MADFKIPRIRFRWKGLWASATYYVKDDIVRYGGKTYVALKTHTSASNFYINFEAVDSQIPPQPDPYWELMQDGYEWTGDWQVSTFYQVGDLAKKNGIVYICISSHTSSAETTFTSDSIKWIVYTSTDNWRYNWNIDTSYSINDIVKYNGSIYRCVFAHVSAATYVLGLEDDFSKWVRITDTESWRGDWTVNTRYVFNDLVRYNGIVYRCNQGHTSHADILAGLEDDFDKWDVFYENIEYKGTWSGDFVRYRKNDVVKYGASLWICDVFHLAQGPFDNSKWSVYIPGFEYDNSWSSSTRYQKGDIVSYGGYNYFAKQNNLDQPPSTETDDWELLTTNFRIRGEYGDDSSNQDYRVGDVVSRGGMLYVAIADSNGIETTNTLYWELLVPGERWTSRWVNNNEYLIGDITTYISTSYRCIQLHTSSSNNRPDVDITNTYWVELVQGNRNNVLAELGDLKTFGSNVENSNIVEPIRREIGIEGQTLTVDNSEAKWDNFNKIQKVYYVAVEGDDTNDGESLEKPWATIKHACESITGPATIFIKTGTYYEELPISIPANVALVGDELRGTTVVAAPGFTTEDMFYVRNATGIRNMTLKGLSGSLGPLNEFGTQRPTAGAYVSLDPGAGPADNTVWIDTRSPYIQNVTTFGTACVGMKVDGNLHNGGNKSITANDFTQVLSDGIGAWVTNQGLSELVSVFTYYNHIGYLAENGGKIRGTNGNCSYGTFGAVAESFDPNEIPITATVNNRSREALVDSIITNVGEIMALEFANAGQNYTTASYTITGAGINAVALQEEIRDNSIYQVRVYTPGDSTPAGGTEYLTVTNNAQGGDRLSITLSVSDDRSPSEYIGMRIVITGGTGAGQYGYITNYNDISKVVTVARESDGQGGWDNYLGGYPVAPVLNTTTVYNIEPRVTFNFPGFTATARTLPQSLACRGVAFGNGYFVAVGSNSDIVSISSNGTTWSNGGVLPIPTGWFSIAFGNGKHVTISTGSDNAAYSTNGGVSWTSSTLPTPTDWSSVTFGNGRFVAISFSGSTTAYSNNGITWTAGDPLPASADWKSVTYGRGIFVAISSYFTSVAAYSTDGITWLSSTLPASVSWSSVTYGNGRFVAVASGSIISAYSFDGNTWYSTQMPVSSSWSSVGYGQGVFLAVTSSAQTVAYSQDGYIWETSGDDSSQFLQPTLSTWSGIAFGTPSTGNIWVTVATGPGNNSTSIVTGARAIARAHVTSNRVAKILLIEPGSGYLTTPTVNVFDPNHANDVYLRVRRGNGVLANPVFTNKGSGWITSTTTATITGDGFSDNYQTGKFLIVNNLSLLPGPGDNLNIEEINDLTYKIITIEELGGSPGNYQAKFRVSPEMDIEESPDHARICTIRQKYSQVRLTGHDFLDIGVGNFDGANYPDQSANPKAPENEVYEKDGGRIFYTSTDQDGNFRVGELFKVEQATGSVTISADLFELTGLSEISLGGVSVGGTGVIIREFSKDGTFTADSNNIIPTQRAIKKYLDSSISGGGSNALASVLTAGVTRVGPQVLGTTTGDPIEVNRKVNMRRGFGGSLLAHIMFSESFNSDPGTDVEDY